MRTFLSEGTRGGILQWWPPSHQFGLEGIRSGTHCSFRHNIFFTRIGRLSSIDRILQEGPSLGNPPSSKASNKLDDSRTNLSSLTKASGTQLLQVWNDYCGQSFKEKECSVIGFLTGSCPEATNLDDMCTLSENHSVLLGLNILCEKTAINLASQALKIPFKLQA